MSCCIYFSHTALYMSRPSSSLFLLSCYGDHRDLHSFPTRRSSDLRIGVLPETFGLPKQMTGIEYLTYFGQLYGRSAKYVKYSMRSEEHTSELQSRSDLVCRLLLEKKNFISCCPHSRPQPWTG